jgi:DNA-binding NarL/FixJ family response regulator
MNVVIIDDDELVTLSLKTIIEADPEWSVLAIGHSGKDAVELYEQFCPDVLLMDVRMGEMDGIQAGEQIMKEHARAKIVYLTTFSDDEYIIKAMRMGAKGYILKQRFDTITPSLKLACQGHTIFGSEIMERLPTLWNAADPEDWIGKVLTQRERDVVFHVAQGCSNKEIAQALFLGEGTIRNYISTILEKLQLRDRTQLAVFYYKHKEQEE